MRFGSAMAGLAVGDITFDGDPRARERPMAPLLNALRIIGVDLVSIGGHLPVTVRGQGHVRGGPVKIDSRASSQFVTALLLSGCRFDEGLTLTSDGGAVPSRAHIDMTLAALRHSSVPVTEDGRTWRIEPAMPVVDRVTIEPDLSNAVPFLGAALLTAGRCRIPGIPRESVQPVTAVISLIEAFGGEVALDDTGLRVTGGRELSGVDLDMSDIGELVPVVTALAAVARSPSRIRGVAHLRGHETDRLAALAREFVALGGDVTETADGLLVNPRPLLGGTFHTYDDHRMATTGALLGLAVSGIEVENVSTTAKTLPGFAGLWSSMLGSSAA
jgi:3-phosphoshikimate 1-carboxyvinyltransferase